MKYRILTPIVLALLASISLRAAPAAAAAQIQLTVNQEVRLFNAIHDGLAGYQSVAKVNGVDTAVTLQYKLTASVRFTLMDDLALLQPEVEAAQRAPAELLKQLAPDGKDIPRGDPRFATYLQQLNDLGNKPRSLPLEKINKQDLDLDENSAITPATLQDLKPIINL